MTWIDSEKTFDSISHSRIRQSLHTNKVASSYIKHAVANWETSITLQNDSQVIKIYPVSITILGYRCYGQKNITCT